MKCPECGQFGNVRMRFKKWSSRHNRLVTREVYHCKAQIVDAPQPDGRVLRVPHCIWLAPIRKNP